MMLLGTEVNIGDKVIINVKTAEKLINEGWLPTESGGLKKDTAYYKFVGDKRSLMGKVVNGTVALNPKRNLCVMNENGWGFDESMIESIIVNEVPVYHSFEETYDGVTFVGENDGSIGLFISSYGEEIERYISADNVKALIHNLMKHHGWID